MSGDGGEKPSDGSRRRRVGLWLSCGVFALAAVFTASGEVLRAPTSSTTAWTGDPVIQGDEILGTRGPDAPRGTPGPDLIFAFGGSDRIDAGGGNDLIDPGNGEDFVSAGPGNDRIRAFDGARDRIHCGEGQDIAYVDSFDVTIDCEETIVGSDSSPPRTPDPPPSSREPTLPLAPGSPVRGTVELEDEAWRCEGPVDMDLVKVTINRRPTPLDAVSLAQNCTGRIGRVEIDTWSGDGIKVQNAGRVAHDLVIESGSIRCYAKTGAYHQEGIQVMGGYRITFRNLEVSCGRPGVNANLFIAQGGKKASLPTDVVFEDGHLGPRAAHTILLADAVRSGVRRTVICPGRWFDYMIQRSAIAPIDASNLRAVRRDPRCK